MRRILTIGLTLAGAVAGLAQNSNIQWQTDAATAVQQAQATRRPLMVYLGGSSRDEDSRVDRDQKRAFRDPTVMRRSQNFVSLKLMYSQKDLLAQFGFHEGAQMEMRFVTPEGKPIDSLSAGGVAQPSSLAQKMALVLQSYGKMVYETEIKPKLEDEKAKPQELRLAVKMVGDFNVKDADKTVVELLDRERLDPALKTTICDTLAALSTKAGADKLLELAHGGDKLAEKSLDKCTPVGAQILLANLKADAEPFDYLVYKTVMRICRIEGAKQARYFENSSLKMKEEEVQRVSELVKTAAAAWKAENE